ncbi:MAG: arsenic resistance protein [Deltaproteobacteria bacterium]|nr:arsenic resistance protein [Deltaproteobacteria bacterium]
MGSLLAKINQKLTWAIPIAMVLGFAFGFSFDASPLKAGIVPLTLLMVYPMMVNLNVRKVLEGGDGKAQVVAQVINFAVVPFFALGLGRLFFPDRPYLVLGLLLAALVPTSGMTISWTGLAKGNVEAAVKMTVVGLTLGSLATPLYLQFLLGESIGFDFARVAQQIGLVVFLPMAAGYLTRRFLVGRWGEEVFRSYWSPRFPPYSTLGVLGIVFAAVALKAKAGAASPQLVVGILIPLLILYLVNYALSTAVGRTLLPRGDAIALVYGTVMRNLSIALAIAVNAFGPQGSEAALVLSIGYIVQVQSAAWYVRFTDRVFGPPAGAVVSPHARRAPAGAPTQ